MIGEIRDAETAQIAIQASLTGHLVFSTLHTNSAAASITRLIDMGVERYLIASTVKAVLAQRLVRACARLRRAAEAREQWRDQLSSEIPPRAGTADAAQGLRAMPQPGLFRPLHHRRTAGDERPNAAARLPERIGYANWRRRRARAA